MDTEKLLQGIPTDEEAHKQVEELSKYGGLVGDLHFECVNGVEPTRTGVGAYRFVFRFPEGETERGEIVGLYFFMYSSGVFSKIIPMSQPNLPLHSVFPDVRLPKFFVPNVKYLFHPDHHFSSL